MNFLKKLKTRFTKNHINTSSQPGWIKKYLCHPTLWHFNRESIARGVAIGLFTGMIPFIPFQTIIAIICSFFLEANLSIAFIVSWVSNPVTIVPIAYFTFYVGNIILGHNEKIILHAIKWDSIHSIASSFSEFAVQFGKPFFIGLPIVALGAALLGYFLVNVIWGASLVFKKRKNI